MDKAIRDRFDHALAKADIVHSSVRQHSGMGDSADNGRFMEWQTQSLTLLRTLFPADHTYVVGFVAAMENPHYDSVKIERGRGVLVAAHNDYVNGYLWTLTDRVRADVFDDFLEMAGSLVGDGYKDAAAVIAGLTLEEHLRKLAAKHKVDTTEAKREGSVVPKKTATINDDLKKTGAYNQIEWRTVQGWLDIRNDAAYGKYGEYTQAQVEQMINGVRDFFIRNPA